MYFYRLLILAQLQSLFTKFGTCGTNNSTQPSSLQHPSTQQTSQSTRNLITLMKVTSHSNQVTPDLKQHVTSKNTPIAFLNSKPAFDKLIRTEKLYVHHMSRASWSGALIDLFQTSAESPYIFLLLQKLYRTQTLNQTKTQAKKQCGFTATEWDALLKYSAAFYHNLGNYLTFGNKKIIPGLSFEKLDCLVTTVGASNETSSSSPSNMTLMSLWNSTGTLMYALGERYRQQGLKPDGITGYLSSNCDEADAKLVREFLVSKRVDGSNIRIFKTELPNGRKSFELRMASVLNTSAGTVDGIVLRKTEEFQGSRFQFSRGDYASVLRQVVYHLLNAQKYAANENEKQAINGYIESFTSGSIIAHKNATRFWVRDKGPTIESYMGFIEHQQDPAGVSGSFEGFVAAVDKEKSSRLGKLVAKAEELLLLLPWPRSMEKDTFLKPDFTDLTVVSMANGVPPAGINLPSYDEVRQTDGFKNVYLSNIIGATIDARLIQFLQKKDADMLRLHRPLLMDVIVGLHELLGHGSGKFLIELQNGTFNFNASEIGNVGTFGTVKTWYKPGETYTSKFGRLAATMEECRADSVAVYLSFYPQVLRIWDVNSTSADTFTYLVWLHTATEGLQALAQYSPETDTWGQPHAQGRFAILRVMIDAGVARVVTVNGTDGLPDLQVTINRTRISAEGKSVLGIFLTGLQFYSSTGDAKGAERFYDRYTSLRGLKDSEFLNWQRIALGRKQPKPLLVQPNTDLIRDVTGKISSVAIKQYNATVEGMIESFQDRYRHGFMENSIFTLANKELNNFLI